jgi:uncharacterized protein YjiK
MAFNSFMKKKLNWVLFIVLLAACTSIDRNETPGDTLRSDSATGETEKNSSYSNTGYSFSSPEKVYELPIALREVSGLNVADNDNLACVQDEEGSIFIYSLAKEEIQERIPFAGKGDFEELSIVGDDAYVLESNGNIFLVPDYRGNGTAQVKKLETSLTKANNAEGMCYDKKNNRLLIACKGKGEEKEHNKKAIYAFDLSTHKLSPDPVILISLKHLKEAISKMSHHHRKQLEKEIETGDIDQVFTPSGIAIHPVTGELYVLSTRNNLLAVLDMSGTIKEITPLTHDLFVQPEGISFAANGDLYISNEGQKQLGNILKFPYEKK